MQFQELEEEKKPVHMTLFHIHIQNLFGISVFKCSPDGLAKNCIQEKIIAQVRTDVNSKLGCQICQIKTQDTQLTLSFL